MLPRHMGGVDLFFDNQLGSLDPSIDGLRARDGLFFDLAREKKLPVAVTPAGGYARKGMIR